MGCSVKGPFFVLNNTESIPTRPLSVNPPPTITLSDNLRRRIPIHQRPNSPPRKTMSLTTTSRRIERGLRNHPTPLDMTLLGRPGSSNFRRVVPIKESVTSLGLDYSLSCGVTPGLPTISSAPPLPRPLPKIPSSVSSRSSPNSISDISSCSSHYTATDASTTSSGQTSLTSPPNLMKLCTVSLPPSPHRQESTDGVIQLPPPSPSSPLSPTTPPLLTPVAVRPARRWGMAVFHHNHVTMLASPTPSSPISPEYTTVSPTSVIAIKSPVEQRDSNRISTFSLFGPFTASLPQEANAGPQASSSPAPTSLPHAAVLEDPTLDIDVNPAPSVPRAPKMTKRSLGVVKEDSLVEDGWDQPPSPQFKTGSKLLFRASNAHRKRTSSVYRRASSARRPYRRLQLKRDSGAPFVHQIAMAQEDLQVSAEEKVKEGQGNTGRWSESRKFMRTSTRRAKAIVVVMKGGKERVEEKDIAAVIPQLRELKTPKWLRL